MMRSGTTAHSSLILLLGSVLSLAALGALAPARAVVDVTLSWTAPGDDGRQGTAARYDLRLSVVPITEANFATSWMVSGIPTPGPAGTRQSVLVPNLVDNGTYYFALKTVDEKGNWSAMSNIVVFTAVPPPTGGPGPVAGLSFSSPQPNPARDLTKLVFELPRPGDVWVEVLDVLGRRVRLLAHEFQTSGRHEINWSLDDASAHPLPAGMYLVRARAMGEVFLRRLAIVR